MGFGDAVNWAPLAHARRRTRSPSRPQISPRRTPGQPSFESPARRRVTIDISAGAVGKIVVGLIALGLISGFMDRMRDVFVWTLAALFLAVALNPLVTRLEPRIGRRPAATVVFVGFLIRSSPSSRPSWRRS